MVSWRVTPLRNGLIDNTRNKIIRLIRGKEVQTSECQERTLFEWIFGVVKKNPQDVQYQCDFVCCAPQRLQAWRTSRCILFWKCWGLFAQTQFLNAFVPSGRSAIERDFSLSSSTSGIITSMSDVGNILLLLPISFWGNKCRRLRLESYGYVLMGVSCFLFAMPHAMNYGNIRPFHAGDPNSLLCKPPIKSINGSIHVSKDGCRKDNDNRRNFYSFILGLALFGFGAGCAPILTTGTAYLDDNTPQSHAPLYIGIYMSFLTVGSASGFVLNSHFLKIYVDVGFNSHNLTVTDIDHWIGAWWIGPILAAIMINLAAIPMFGFPRELPDSLYSRTDESFGTTRRSFRQIKGNTITSFFQTFKVMLENRTLMVMMVVASSEMFFISGMLAFGTKILETKFNLNTSVSTLYAGGTFVCVGVLGFISGGALYTYGKLTVRNCLRYLAVISFFCTPLVGSVLIPCSSVNSKKFNSISHITNCSHRCGGCSSSGRMFPGCGADGTSYPSPCYAGCRYFTNNTYGGCSCIVPINGTLKEWENGRCPTQCSNFVLYITLASLCVFLTFFMACPALNVVIRIVPKRQKAMALGLVSLASRILGSIPAPVLLGNAIDNACLVTVGKSCDQKGSCGFYDQHKLSVNLVLVLGFVKLLSTILLTTAAIVYQPPLDGESTSNTVRGELQIDSEINFTTSRTSSQSLDFISEDEDEIPNKQEI